MKITQLAECIEKKAFYNLLRLEESEFNKIVFAGAGTTTPRGPSDAFTKDELLTIAGTAIFDEWSSAGKFWLWSSIDMYDELEQDATIETKKDPLMNIVGMVLLALLPVSGMAQDFKLVDKKGQTVMEGKTNKAGGVNVTDGKGRVIATGQSGRGDTVLRDAKGRVVATIKGGKK